MSSWIHTLTRLKGKWDRNNTCYKMSKMGKMTGLLGVCILCFLHTLHWWERPESWNKCDGVYDNRAAITKHCRKTAHWCNYMWQVAVSRLSGCLIKNTDCCRKRSFPAPSKKKVCTSLAPVYPVLILTITPISTHWGATESGCSEARHLWTRESNHTGWLDRTQY